MAENGHKREKACKRCREKKVSVSVTTRSKSRLKDLLTSSRGVSVTGRLPKRSVADARRRDSHARRGEGNYGRWNYMNVND